MNMIRLFQKIYKVGRYDNYIKSALSEEQEPEDFKQFNLLYGENGTGKTTLTHILRSLQGSNELLLKKTTFDYADSPEVHLISSDLNKPDLVYQNFEWSQYEPNLEIFDVHFINENIYTGLEIQNNHKKRLFEIILGDKGIQLKKEIQALKLRVQKGNKIIRETTKSLENNIAQAYPAIEYAHLEADPDIEEKIYLKEIELQTAKNQRKIQRKETLSILPTIDLPFEIAAGTAIFKQSLDFISANYLEKFSAHTQHLGMKGKAEEWLQQGFEAKYDGKCPFCLQTMDTELDILQAYQQYFSTTYKTLLLDIEQLNKSIAKYSLEALLSKIENALTLNKVLLEFWKDYLPVTPTLETISEEKDLLIATFEQVKNLVKQKSTNPIEAIDAKNLQDFHAIVEQLNQKIAQMNKHILAYNNRISAVKNDENKDISIIEKELATLVAIEKRIDPDIDILCKNLIKYKTAVLQLKQQTKTKNGQLNEFRDVVFNASLDKINFYLNYFAPYLSLRELTSAYLGSSTEPAVKFALCVNGKAVAHKEKGNLPSMKYSLSEGDKNALALSFFFAKLEADEMLSQKIIVFDDPIASFDRIRLAKTIQQLLIFGKKSQQLFFLTHNLRFGLSFMEQLEEERFDFSKNQICAMGDSSAIVGFKRT